MGPGNDELLLCLACSRFGRFKRREGVSRETELHSSESECSDWFMVVFLYFYPAVGLLRWLS